MKRGKRLTALLLAFAMCLSILPANVLAAELGSEEEATEVVESKDSGEPVEGEPIEVEEPQATEEEETVQEPEKDESPSTMAATSGKCGKNVTWKLDSKGTLTISGTGEMYDYFAVASPWEPHIFKIKAIDIKEGVTKIGASAFSAHNVKTLKIPNSVTSIGESAFSEFGGVKTVKLPSKLKEIGEFAFSDWFELNSIIIPDGVTSIPNYAFKGCYRLKSIVLSKNVTRIGECAFSTCRSLKSIELPETLERIDWGMFLGCENLKEIYFRGNAPIIDEDAFGESPAWPEKLTATAYYPENDPTWTSDKLKDYGGNITWKTWNPDTDDSDFDAAIYQTKFSLNNEHNTEIEKFDDSPSRVLYDTGTNEGLTNATIAWKSITQAVELVDRPSSVADVAIEKRDIYTAIILSVFEADNKDEQTTFDNVKKAQTLSSQLMSYLKTGMKTKHNIDVSKENDLTKMTKDEQAKLFLMADKWLEEQDNFVTNFSKGLEISGKAIKYVTKLDEYCDYVASAHVLVSMDCYNKQLMTELYNNATNSDLKWALSDCVKIMESNQSELHELLANKLMAKMTVSGFQECTDLLWGAVKESVKKTCPYAAMFLEVCKLSYNVSKDASNLLCNTDRISENYLKVGMVLNVEAVMLKVYKEGKETFRKEQSHENAELANHAVRLLYNCYDVDCQYALNFVTAVDDAAISVIKRALKLKDRSELTKQIESIRKSSRDTYWSVFNNGWIIGLKSDYPEEYKKYQSLLHYNLLDTQITLSDQSMTYTGKKLTPNVTVKDTMNIGVKPVHYKVSYSKNKDVGTATVTVTGTRLYYGTVQKTFTINPKGVALSKLTNSKSKTMTVTWKKNSTVTGYQVQYSTSKSFKSPKTVTVKKAKTTSTTIKKLTKGKKYYVRIRTYQKVSGKNYYSSWSSSKTVTIKK